MPSVGFDICVIQTSSNLESRKIYDFKDNLIEWMKNLVFGNPIAKPATVVLDHENRTAYIEEV